MKTPLIPMYALILCIAPFVSIASQAQVPVKLVIASHVPVKVKEPSDIAQVPGDADKLYVVSDQGRVAEIDHAGNTLMMSGDIAYDLEGCTVHGGQLMVVDERTRRVLWIDTKDLSVQRQLTIPYNGGRNKGYEGVVWNQAKERFVLVTERDPVALFELDTAMRVVNEMPFDRHVRDISAITWHDGSVWLLSDMDRMIMRCDPKDYHIIARYEVPVINPEGLAIDEHGVAWVMSDDRQTLYSFQLPK